MPDDFAAAPDRPTLPPIDPVLPGVSDLDAALQGVLLRGAALAREAADNAARLQAVHDLSWRLNAIHEIEAIGEAIVAESHRLIGHDTIRVYRVDQAAGTCEPVAFRGEFMGVEHPGPDVLRVPIGVGLTGWVAAHNETIRTSDAARDPRSKLVGQERGPESLLVVPMSIEGRVVGVIVVSRLGEDDYDDHDQRLMETFAGYAAQAMVNAENIAELNRQRQELALKLESQRRLLAVTEQLMATLDAEGVLDLIADSLAALVHYDTLMIYRVDRVAGVRRPVLARGPQTALIMSHRPAFDAGLNGWVSVHGEAVLANDVHLDPRAETIPGTVDDPESMIVCPLMVNGVPEGTLAVSREGGPEVHFSEAEFETVRLFAGQAALAIHNASTHRAVRFLADTDALTGVRSRGAFDREIEERVAEGHPFGLVMIDLDRFKAYNDAYGHLAGDALLVGIGEAINGSIRDGDRAYRYGGDEFAVIMSRVDEEDVTQVAGRVCAAIAAVAGEGTGADDAHWAGEGFPEGAGGVTASAGTSMFPREAATREAVVDTADRRLYDAKRGGRPTSAGPSS